MARNKAANALAEASGDNLTAEESQLMNDNQASEHAEPELPLEIAKAPEAEKETIASPEAQAQPDIDPETGKQRKVDYGAFHAEREKRKASDAKAQEAERNLATALGRFSVLEQIAKQQTAPAQATTETIPDINTDPVGHFKAQFEKTQRELADVTRWRQAQEGEKTALNNAQQLARIAADSEVEFTKSTPDYADAAKHLIASRTAELKALGFKDGDIQQYIRSDSVMIAAQALNNNMSPAAVVYEFAKARGYQARAAAAVADPAQTADALKIAAAAKGQKEASPLGQVGGQAAATTSVDALLKMSDADFEKATQGDNWRKLFA